MSKRPSLIIAIEGAMLLAVILDIISQPFFLQPFQRPYFLMFPQLTNPTHSDPGLHSVSSVPPPPPPGLKEISAVASWTVSSSKPGCGISALRAPSTALFWQSDGPQPHFLNIHFFKMVSIVAMRIYLDFELDESYTPTLIRFAAGTGYNDLQVWSELRVEQPRGWVNIDFEGVGETVNIEDEHGNVDEDVLAQVDKMPVLRCMLVQVRICENHQNGKDTHLRGLQIFSKDEGARKQMAQANASPKAQRVGLGSGRDVLRGNLPVRQGRSRWDLDEWLTVPTLR
jgi:anaphase-promoting complex subunit 10